MAEDDNDPATLLPCACTGCVQPDLPDLCEACRGLQGQPASAGGCVCGGPYGDTYWTTV